jgi:CTP:molybdopterin cytidylyltransferase MocA
VDAPAPVTGLLLAAGAGRRAGGPKALRVRADGVPWLTAAVDVLLSAGCTDVVVVLGSAADRARLLLASAADPVPDRVRVVENSHWSAGMSTSLAAGLGAVAPSATAALVHLVDLPDVTAAVASRVLREAAAGPGCLARAVYAGIPGHPVLLGRDHVGPVLATLAGDGGAQPYLQAHGAVAVECGDLATGRDVDLAVGG